MFATDLIGKYAIYNGVARRIRLVAPDVTGSPIIYVDVDRRLVPIAASGAEIVDY